MSRKILLLALLLCNGCTVISYNRVFPKLTWYWTDDAKEQRREKAAYEASAKAYREQQNHKAP